MNSHHLSQFEFCPRLPGLDLAGPPPQEPVREAVKRQFAAGVKQVLTAADLTAPIDFLTEASTAGFLYPSGDPFTLAQDYSCWLDGVLRIVEELGLRLIPIPPLQVGPGARIQVETAYDSPVDGTLHLFLIGSDADAHRWPLLLSQLLQPVAIQVHLFPLPSARGGRLSTPLTIAYRHPLTGTLRLATLDGEKGFSPKWLRVGRWEEGFEWGEWREGINRDQCMEQIYQHRLIYPRLEPEQLKEIRGDALAIINAIPFPHPRLREACTICPYSTICHSPEEDSSDADHDARSLVTIH